MRLTIFLHTVIVAGFTLCEATYAQLVETAPPRDRQEPDRGDRDDRRRRGGPRDIEGEPGERVAPDKLNFELGVATIPDRETFEQLSYQGTQVETDRYLTDLEYVKFVMVPGEHDTLVVYFMNTETNHGHPGFMREIGITVDDKLVIKQARPWVY